MSAGTDKLREWSTADRDVAAKIGEQIAAIQYISALKPGDARASQSAAQAAELHGAKALLNATADGWDAIVAAADVASGEVVDPEQHP